jgi:hypothetical protein
MKVKKRACRGERYRGVSEDLVERATAAEHGDQAELALSLTAGADKLCSQFMFDYRLDGQLSDYDDDEDNNLVVCVCVVCVVP